MRPCGRLYNLCVAEYHMNLGYISRSGGKSATANSAYIACTILQEARTGLVFDYSKKQGLLYHAILAPEACPEWVYDQQTLWNTVEAFEDNIAQKRFRGHKDPEKNEKSLAGKEKFLGSCKTAYTANFAIPIEIENPDHIIELSTRIVKECYVKNGLIAEHAIHADKGNPHLHILSTTRPWEDGNFSERRFTIEREKLIEIRHAAAKIANDFAMEKGYNYVLDARSYEDQGLTLLPSRHLGPKAYHKHKEASRVAQENAEIQQENLLILFNKPEEIIKLVATKKVVFTSTDIEREIFKRVGGDAHLYNFLKARLLNVEVDGIHVSPEMLRTTNDNMSLKGEALKADFKETVSSYAQHMLHREGVVEVGKNLRDEVIFTTKKAIELEKEAKEYVQHLSTSEGKVIFPFIKKKAISNAEKWNKFDFSDEQKQAIYYLLGSQQLLVLKGNAGTGKTTVLKPVVDAYKRVGYIPLGVAFQGTVSELLSHDLGISAYTLDQLGERWRRFDKIQKNLSTLKGKAFHVATKELEKLKAFQLTKRHVVILDEGNMVGSNHWQELLSRVQKAGAHLRIVQDTHQIKAIYGADISRLIEEEAGHFELTEVHRQKEAWMREASSHLNSHNLLEGLKPYDERGYLTFKESMDSTRYALVEAYINHLEAHPDELHIALSFQNRDVEELNAAIRHQLKQKGSLGEGLTFKGREFSVGERVIFTQNDHTEWFVKTIGSPSKKNKKSAHHSPGKGVKNGTFGYIEAFDQKSSTLDVRLLKDGRLVRVNLKTYDTIEYGYAMTVNKAEGKTFDWVYGLFDPLMNANTSLIWMTRHRNAFYGFISKEQASTINEMATASGRSDYRPLVSDFNIEGSGEAHLLKEYMRSAYEAADLWGIISKENTESPTLVSPFEPSAWVDFQAAQQVRNQLAEEILENWDGCRSFANQVGIKRVTLEVQADLKQRALSPLEIEALQKVETYRSVTSQARHLWDKISTSGTLPKAHPHLRDYEECVHSRNQIAYEIVSFPAVHSPFFKTTKKEDTYITYGGESYDKTPASLKAAQRHSQAYIRTQQQKAFSEKLTPFERGAFAELISFKKQIAECGRLVSALKNESPLNQQSSASLKSALEEASRTRDFVAFKIVKFFEKYSPLMERADLSPDQLLKYAVFGEVRQLALKHNLAKTVEGRLDFANQLYRMVGDGETLDKPLLGILKGYDIDISRLRFERGCLELMKKGEEHLPFKTVSELSSAFVSLNDYRVTHREAAKNWHIIKTHTVEKVSSLQDAQIMSLNTWKKASPHPTDKEREDILRQDLEKACPRPREGGELGKQVPLPRTHEKAPFKKVANAQTLSWVTQELARVVNNYEVLSSTDVAFTDLQNEIRARHGKLMHFQSHLRKGRSGYVGIFKMDHGKDKTWENLRKKKLFLASEALEKCGEVLSRVSFGNDYKRMEKEAYEYNIDQLVSKYQEMRGEEKATLAAEILSHLEQEGYRGESTKTQLKNRDVSFEALYLFGLFHQVRPSLDKPKECFNKLQGYVEAQETFSALWKPRCEVIDKELDTLKEHFNLNREELISHLEYFNPRKPCAFTLDTLLKEVSHEASNYQDSLELQSKVQEKLQHLDKSFEWNLTKEDLKILSQEVINLSQRKDQIHEERLSLMKKTPFENNPEFFESARNRNEAAFHLMNSPIGSSIEDSKDVSIVKNYAARFKETLEKEISSFDSSFGMDSDEINENNLLQNRRLFISKERVEEAIKQHLVSFADDVVSSLGERCNRACSSATSRRYGKDGHISVNLRNGSWHDFKLDKGGGPLQMVMEYKGFSTFEEAKEYAAQWAGLSGIGLKSFSSPSLSSSSSLAEKEKRNKEAALEAQIKIQQAQVHWKKGIPLKGTIAERYLKEHRKIGGTLPKDLRFLPSFKVCPREGEELRKHNGKSFPCLMAAARSPSGEVTAVQITYLDPHTAGKANIPISKKSFGVLKGSFVTLREGRASDPIFVAEGVETALSLKEAGVQGTIKASLGLFNIKRLEPKDSQTPLIICADHDAVDSPATQNLEKSVTALQEKGFAVSVVKPNTLGEDFNDVLKKKGPEGVQAYLKPYNSNTGKPLHETQIPEKGSELSKESRNRGEKSEDIKQQTKGETPVVSMDVPSREKTNGLKDVFSSKELSYADLQAKCTQRLLEVYERERGHKPSSEKMAFLKTQAESTTDYLYHAFTLKGQDPTPKEVENYSRVSRYILERIPHLHKELIEKGKSERGYEKTYALKALIIAERIATIEGRLLLKAQESGNETPKNYRDLAYQEFTQHQINKKGLASDLAKQHKLSKDNAFRLANEVLRYREKYGSSPSNKQTTHMISIVKYIEQRDKELLNSSHNYGLNQRDLLRRKETDQLLTYTTVHNSFPDPKSLKAIQREAMSFCQKQLDFIQEHACLQDRGRDR